jgi:hypothetical protein
VSSTRFHRVGATGIAALTVVALVSGCNSSKSSSSAAATSSTKAAASTAAAPAAAASTAPSAAAAAPSSAAAAVPSGSAAVESAIAAAVASDAATQKPIVATGGGKFCKEAAAVSNAGLSAAASGTTPDAVKAQIAQFKVEEKTVLASAPGAIKGDLVILFGGVDKLYSALVAANYDYTKVDPTTLTSFDTPAFEAASDKVDAYLKTTCGIDTGDEASDSPAAS